MKDWLVETRRTFHMHPELGFAEEQTGKRIGAFLDEWQVERQTGIPLPNAVGVIRGQRLGKVLALRADFDALPIQEENTVPYKSQNPGVMHACGHDAHTTMLLGATRILLNHTDLVEGTIKLFFQQAEEKHPGGAKVLIEAGALGNPKVDVIFGQHVQAHVKVGDFAVRTGPAMAAADVFRVVIKGRGGHGGHFYRAIDSIVIAAQIINAIQTISSRKLSPFDPVALSVCQIHGGKTDNVMPDDVELTGTIRSFDRQVRQKLIDEFEKTVAAITQYNGAAYTFEVNEGYPFVNNDPVATAFGKEVARQLVGEEHVYEYETPSMGGEDFSRYQELIPGAFFNIGVGNPEKGITASIHNSHFDIDEDALPLGAAFLAATAVAWLKEHHD